MKFFKINLSTLEVSQSTELWDLVEGETAFSTVEGLSAIALTLAQFATIYNAHRPEGKSPVNRFPDKVSAVKRTWNALNPEEEVFVNEETENAEEPTVAPETAPEGPTTEPEGEAAPEPTPEPAAPKRTRASARSEQRVWVKPGATNPHRKGSLGYETFEFVAKHPGLTYAEYRDNARLRTRAFVWQLSRGYLTTVDPAGEPAAVENEPAE